MWLVPALELRLPRAGNLPAIRIMDLVRQAVLEVVVQL